MRVVIERLNEDHSIYIDEKHVAMFMYDDKSATIVLDNGYEINIVHENFIDIKEINIREPVLTVWKREEIPPRLFFRGD